MTETQPPEDSAPLTPDQYSPLVPRPMVTAIAGIVAALLAFNVVYDAFSKDYSGTWVTFLLGSIVLVIFGVPFGKALAGLKP